MGLLEFSKLPVNTLVGADWQTFKEMTAGQHIAKDRKGKYYLTKAVCRLLSLMASFQERKYKKLLADKPLENDPVFILDIGVAVLPLCIISLLKTSTSVIQRPIKPFSHT